MNNLEVLTGLYAEAQEKLRAMLPILASELGVPVGEVTICASVRLGSDTVSLHAPDPVWCCLETSSTPGAALAKVLAEASCRVAVAKGGRVDGNA